MTCMAVVAYDRKPGEGCVVDVMRVAVVVCMTIDPCIPTMPGTEHFGFSPTRQALLAPSVSRREVFGESHVWWAA